MDSEIIQIELAPGRGLLLRLRRRRCLLLWLRGL